MCGASLFRLRTENKEGRNGVGSVASLLLLITKSGTPQCLGSNSRHRIKKEIKPARRAKNKRRNETLEVVPAQIAFSSRENV